MTAWKPIPADHKIPHGDMVLIRKLSHSGGWHVELAYKSIAAGWRAGNGAYGIEGYIEWTEIPA